MNHGWTEDDSNQFLELAEVITPSRQEQLAMLIDLIPASPADAFNVVELGCGSGELAAMILKRFSAASYLGLDGSTVMLEHARHRSQKDALRATFRAFSLQDREWRRQITKPVHCFMSSLAVHHLADDEKKILYQDLYHLVRPKGALLLIDIVLPAAAIAKDAVAAAWDSVVLQQSRLLKGHDGAFETFKNGGWNCYRHPDPMDMPAALFDQLRWLSEAGFSNVDCFWQRAGHAVFGGYKADAVVDGPSLT